jgi:tetratricopeptide (TPR) repeat protein
MPDTIRCPACGQENPADSPRCGSCGHPLRPAAVDGAPAPGATPPPAEDEPVIYLRRPVRPPRPQPVIMNPLVLWGSVAVVVGAALVFSAYTGAHRPRARSIEGATRAQQRAADSLRAVLGRDSTDVGAAIAYGNILYDTANWAEATGYYARALARDSSLVRVLVDLGVCWYNRGDPAGAERLFQLALRREPGDAVALYNLGYLKERAGDDAAALRCFHQSLAAGASGATRQAVLQHLGSIRPGTGRPEPPFAPDRAPAERPGRAAATGAAKGRT